MITLALAQMFFFYCLRARFTGGEDGIQGVPRGKLLGVLSLEGNRTMYFVVLAIFLFGLLLHPAGGPLAVRSGTEGGAGERAPRGVARATSPTSTSSSPSCSRPRSPGSPGRPSPSCSSWPRSTDVYWTTSGEVILMVLLGGLGTIFGPVVGAVVIVCVESFLAGLGGWVTVVQGGLFVVCVLAFRRGIVGELPRSTGRSERELQRSRHATFDRRQRRRWSSRRRAATALALAPPHALTISWRTRLVRLPARQRFGSGDATRRSWRAVSTRTWPRHRGCSLALLERRRHRDVLGDPRIRRSTSILRSAGLLEWTTIRSTILVPLISVTKASPRVGGYSCAR